MALLIKDNCTNCDMCEPECPNVAISFGEEIYQINPDLCTECFGFYEEPTCVSVCPINNCIVVDPERIETEDELLIKFAEIYKDGI